jgi:hypothetical protein
MEVTDDSVAGMATATMPLSRQPSVSQMRMATLKTAMPM